MNHTMMSADPVVIDLIQRALREDVGSGDITTQSIVSPGKKVAATIIAREPCIISGTDVAVRVFAELDSDLECEVLISDGNRAKAGDDVVRIYGSAVSMLTAERTALNFMQRMSGIATLTGSFVDKVSAYGTIILDTRKTTPSLRILEKYSVRCGGGTNHRMGLYDRFLIKDNHRALWKDRNTTMGLDDAVRAARAYDSTKEIEIEVETEEELRLALEAEPDRVLLDNMAPVQMKKCVNMCRGICRTEASGGIDIETFEEIAATGVDAISLGCLTHSARAVDLSLEVVIP